MGRAPLHPDAYQMLIVYVRQSLASTCAWSLFLITRK